MDAQDVRKADAKIVKVIMASNWVVNLAKICLFSERSNRYSSGFAISGDEILRDSGVRGVHDGASDFLVLGKAVEILGRLEAVICGERGRKE